MNNAVYFPREFFYRGLVVSLFVLFPYLFSLAVKDFFKNFHFVQIPLHSAIEAGGGVVAILLAILIFLSRERLKNSESVFFAFGLLSMGILDSFHSLVSPGNSFVWLHSLATFFGGAIACSVMFFNCTDCKPWVWMVTFLSAGLGVVSLVFPFVSLPMFLDKHFSGTAIILNVAGGIFFIIVAILLLKRSSQVKNNELLAFSIIAASLGVAGILFHSSSLWDFDWWLWHGVRIVAYSIALFYVGKIVSRTQAELIEKYDLKQMVETLNVQQEQIESKSWVTNGLLQLNELIREEKQIDDFASKALNGIANYLGVHVGVFYLRDVVGDKSELKFLCGYAFDKGKKAPPRFKVGSGSIGQAAATQSQVVVTDFPEDHLTVRSGLGESVPKVIYATPLVYKNTVVGVIELGLQKRLSNVENDYLKQCADALAVEVAFAQRA